MPRSRRQRQRREARRLAGAAVPTKGSIYREYDRAIGDVGGFTQALVSLLRDQGPNPYHAAIAGAKDIQEAGMQRLADLGVDPGATATLGAGQDQSLEGLLARGAAEGAYARRQPGIAASRGALAQQGLVQGRTDALHERADAFRSAFVQAIQQVKENAFQHQQFRAQRKDANRNYQLQQQQFEEQKRQFEEEQQRLRDQFVQSQASGGMGGFTPTQIRSMQGEAYDGAKSAAANGVGPQRFINEAIARGIPRQLAVYAASRAYGSLQLGPQPQQGDFSGTNADAAFKAAMNTWQGTRRAMDAYRHWMEQIQSMQRRKSDKRKLKQGKAPDMSWLTGGL